MLKPGDLTSLGIVGFIAALAGLASLVITNLASPGCTGPAVARCDYVATAKSAVAQSPYRPFQPDLGFEIFDEGSSVRVQQYTPPGEPGLNHAPSVLIDRDSCRPCSVDWHVPTNGDRRDPPVGPLIARVPADDPVAAEARARRWEGGPGGTALL